MPNPFKLLQVSIGRFILLPWSFHLMVNLILQI